MSEPCEPVRALLPEYWSGAISVKASKEVEQHLESCQTCREESVYLQRVWTGLDLIPPEAPGPALRARFYESLDAYRRGAEETLAKAPSQWWTRNWWTRPALQFAGAAAMLAIGVYFGQTFELKRDTTQIGQLRGEVDHMRQLVALSLMQQQSATERLEGVNWTYRVEKSDTEVVGALLQTVRQDASINVRLAAVEALRGFAKSSSLVRKALVQSLAKQDSPMVEIALIDVLVELRERPAVAALAGLSDDPGQSKEVRERAREAVSDLKNK